MTVYTNAWIIETRRRSYRDPTIKCSMDMKYDPDMVCGSDGNDYSDLGYFRSVFFFKKKSELQISKISELHLKKIIASGVHN